MATAAGPGAARRAVLGIGVSADHKHDEAGILKVLAEERMRAAALGLYLDWLLFDDATEVTAQLKDKLQSRHWDCFAIGFGVRGNQRLTEVFEQIVNICVQEVKPVPRFVFQLTPDGITEGVRRLFFSPETGTQSAS